MIPLDCIIYLIRYINDSKDYLKLLLLCKELYRKMYNENYTCNIELYIEPDSFTYYNYKPSINITLPISIKNIHVDNLYCEYLKIISNKFKKNIIEDDCLYISKIINELYLKNEYIYYKNIMKHIIDFKNIDNFRIKTSLFLHGNKTKLLFGDETFNYFNDNDEYILKKDFLENIISYRYVSSLSSDINPLFIDVNKSMLKYDDSIPKHLFNNNFYIVKNKKFVLSKFKLNIDDEIMGVINMLNEKLNGIYICGSTILNSYVLNKFKSNDIDIIYTDFIRCDILKNKYNRKIYDCVKDILSSKHTVFSYSVNKLRCIFEIITKNKVKYTLDIFYNRNVYNIIKNFHLPCVRAFYCVSTKKVYGTSSFIRFLKTGICYNFIGSNIYKSREKDIHNIIKIYTKYFNRGCGFVFNKRDFKLFKKYIYNDPEYEYIKINEYEIDDINEYEIDDINEYEIDTVVDHVDFYDDL